ncbi:MAG: GNAT family N-acetyltransferase [Planktomarina sp.]
MTDPNLPIGPALSFTGPWPAPDGRDLVGRRTTLRKLIPEHAPALFDAFVSETADRNWIYLPFDKPSSRDAFTEMLTGFSQSTDPLFYTVFDAQDRAVGFASYLRIMPDVGSIEVGWLSMSPLMQRSITSTEAMYLMMHHAFETLGYRRYEWKCDSLNAPSRAAAERLGFQHEGTFRQATHYKGRSRDTAWFAIIDGEWPDLHKRFQRYLSPDNFDAGGQQIKRLSEV